MPESRRAIEALPVHLAPYVVQQDPSLYTWIDHASWRFILKISKRFFAGNAHQKYLDGLVETGISTDRIPLISEMDSCLRKFGWRAVAVSGFIPPAAFMEFQSLGVLPIACDMRKLENLAYTPAPDIVHEAAGHAPIISDPEYSAYLRAYGEVSRKAILSHHDLSVYRAIRKLSEVKENPDSSSEAITRAQADLDQAVEAVDFDSEASLLARMNWWTVEYGLVGDLSAPKIYGAGLLSSVGESYSCLGPAVKKIPLTLECIQTAYDITRPQPQLFVTPNFQHLTRVLESFSGTMAYRLGGPAGLDKALQARAVTTSELDSGVQVGGLLEEWIQDKAGQPAYLRYSGPCQIAEKDLEIEKQGARYHREGFGTPVGRVVWRDQGGGSLSRDPQSLQPEETQRLQELEFESGVKIQGRVRGEVRSRDRLLVLTWENCTVRMGDRILFRPEWGLFDMACGTRVTSVSGGAPDRGSYQRDTEATSGGLGFQKTNLTDENLVLNEWYGRLRQIRDSGAPKDAAQSALALDRLTSIFEKIEADFPADWLLRWELLELDHLWKLKAPWRQKLLSRLASFAAKSTENEQLIRRGLELLA
jgi:phenylalanine-4-hydroxylase